jgi:hypothetical protein
MVTIACMVSGIKKDGAVIMGKKSFLAVSRFESISPHRAVQSWSFAFGLQQGHRFRILKLIWQKQQFMRRLHV